MGSDNNGIADQSASAVLQLHESFQKLNQMRVDLDNSLATLLANDEKRDCLWLELESIVAQISELVARLAATPSAEPAELRAKASGLAVLLRTGEINPSAVPPETVALAISLADEVSRTD
jgi:hypothetical protein